MKAITLWPLWASLIAIEAKKIETRSWYTRYRGPLAIHAAKKYTKEMRELELKEPFCSALRRPAGNYCYPSMSCGCIVAVVNLTGCWKIEDGGFLPGGFAIDDEERAFGDYTKGRYAWTVSLIKRLHTPIPYKGNQGLFDVPDELLLSVNYAGRIGTHRVS